MTILVNGTGPGTTNVYYEGGVSEVSISSPAWAGGNVVVLWTDELGYQSRIFEDPSTGSNLRTLVHFPAGNYAFVNTGVAVLNVVFSRIPR